MSMSQNLEGRSWEAGELDRLGSTGEENAEKYSEKCVKYTVEK